jgi:hypothetical protein
LGHLPFAEALQAGRLGLWQAILDYDPQRGPAFSTYAWSCLVRHVWRAAKTAQRFAQPGPKKGGEALLASFPHQEPDPFTAWECAARHAALYDLLARLPGRLRHFMVAHYGLTDDPPASFRRLGATLGLSAERMFLLQGWQITNDWRRTQTLKNLHDPPYADYAQRFGFQDGIFPTKGGLRYSLTALGANAQASGETVEVPLAEGRQVEVAVQTLNRLLAGALHLIHQAGTSPQAWQKALVCADGMRQDAASRMRCPSVQG